MLDERIWYVDSNDKVQLSQIGERQVLAIVVPENNLIDLPSDAFVGVFKYSDTLHSRYRALVCAQEFVDQPMSNYILADNAEILGEHVMEACPT